VTSIDHMLKRGTGLVLEMRAVPYEEQLTITCFIWDHLPRRRGAAFDATGSGGFVAEGMSRRFGKYDPKEEAGGMIAEIRLSVDWYRLHMPKLKAAFEDGTITIPRDADLLSDLRLVKVVQGVALIPALRTGTVGLKRHGDYAVAKALAWYATLMNTADYDYESLGASTTSQTDRFMRAPDDDDFRRGDDDWRTPLGADITGSL
jgi:phage FluMu gp28-like protein